MPRGDRTGPMGMGPRTGRAAGYCAGYSVPGYANPLPGQGAGLFGRGAWGGGGGRGYRNWYHATGLTGWQRAGLGWPPAYAPAPPYAPPFAQMPPEEETKVIKSQIDMLEQSIKAARERLDQLEAERDKKE